VTDESLDRADGRLGTWPRCPLVMPTARC